MPFHPQPAEAVKEQRTESLAEQAESHDAGHADFAKSKVYEGPLKVLDFEFQSALYKKRYKKDSLDLNEHLLNQPKIQRIEKNLQNFAKLYLAENSNFKSDSVSISVKRDPMILNFQPDFKNDFTYEIGKGVFFKTHLNFNQ